MQTIINHVLKNELTFEGVVVLQYQIEYPEITGNTCTKGVRAFNFYNLNKALELQKKCENELFREAVTLYQYNKENGYPIMVYEIISQYNMTFQSENIISLYFDEYTFAGGAHGNTIRTSQTWNLNCGRMLGLAEFFKDNPYFMVGIFKCILKQIEKNPEIYFENYCTLVVNTFNACNFFLCQDDIYIYYQQYDIAPYSSGIRNFRI